MAALFAVGLPFTCDGTTNHFATTTGGSATVAAVTSADDVTVDGNSGNATLTVGATWSCKTLTINNASATVACDSSHGITALGAVTLTAGTLNTNGQACAWGSFVSSNSNTRTLTLGASTITLTGTGTVWNTATVGGFTVSAASSTVVLGPAATATRTFAGGGKTYGTLTYTVANSPGALAITGNNNTFANLNVGPGRQLIMPSSTTNTFNGWNVNGAPNGYLYLPGVAGNYASTPNTAALDITGDIDVRCKVALDKWKPTTDQDLVNRDIPATAGPLSRSFSLFIVNTTGKIQLLWSTNGYNGGVIQITSTVAPTIADGATLWIRATLKANNGAAGNDVKFWTSSDGSTWAQLGTTITTAGTTSINAGTADLFIGQRNDANGSISGKIFRAQVRNNILDDGTGIVFDADFTTKAVGANTFAESSANAATVTINGALAQVGDGRVTVASSAAGTQATIAYTGAGPVNSDYLTLQDSAATPANTWFAGHNSVSVSGNSGWTFGATGIRANANETALAADVVTRLVTTGRTSSTAVLATDVAIRSAASCVRLASELVNASETPTRLMINGRNAADVATTVEAAIRFISATRAAADTATTSDSVTRVFVLIRGGTDAATADNATLRQVVTLRTAADYTLANDWAVAVPVLSRAAQDRMEAIDAVISYVVRTGRISVFVQSENRMVCVVSSSSVAARTASAGSIATSP